MTSNPKLYEITFERFPEPWGEGYLESDFRVFYSKREAEKYGRDVEADDNSILENYSNDNAEDRPVYVRFIKASLVREIDGYKVSLSPVNKKERG